MVEGIESIRRTSNTEQNGNSITYNRETNTEQLEVQSCCYASVEKALDAPL